MRIRKVTEPFRHLSDEPVKVIIFSQPKTVFREPAIVIPIRKKEKEEKGVGVN